MLRNLLDSGEELRVIVRDPSDIPPGVRKGLDVVEGSHGDAAVVDKAFSGADAVFWLTPPDPRALSVEAAFVGFTRPAAEAFGKHGVGRVVAVPAWPGHALGLPGRLRHRLSRDGRPDRQSTGVAYRALTNPSFMDNTIRQAPSIKNHGIFFSPIAGDRKLPPSPPATSPPRPSRLLLDPSWSGVGEVPSLGPEDLSFNDMAQIMSEVLGKEVRFQQNTFEAYKERFISFGMSDAMAQGMTDMAWAKNEGLDNGVPRTPEYSTPTSFRQWTEEVLKPAVAS